MDSFNIRDSASFLTEAVFNRPRLSVTAREAQPWTTTRCHRLLRPLKTHISALRREVERENAEDLDGEAAGDGVAGTAIGRIQHTYSRRGRRPMHPKPAAETPRAPKVRKLSRKQVLQPGEIVLPTPIIRRARGQQLSPPAQQPSLPAQSGEQPRCRRRARDLWSSGSPASTSVISALEIEMLTLRSRISPTRYSFYESILRALHALLLATAEPATTAATMRTTGTKSLMAMCLRKVPDYIGELEDWEELQAEEEGTRSALRVSEVSNEVYDAVEQRLRPGRGCPQLRTVARAHGMKVVKDALLDGLLEDSFSHLLVQLCVNMKASLEVQELLAIMVDRPYPKPRGVGSTFDESRKLAPLRALRSFAQESDRPQFMLRLLSSLLSRQQLPLTWLSTKEFPPIWSGIVNSLFSGTQVCDDTVFFAAHMITTLSSQAKLTAFILRPEANDLRNLSQQTLLSAITAMASLPSLHQEAKNRSQHVVWQKSVSSISRRVGYVIHACIYELRRTRKSGWILTVLRLAAYFTSSAHDGSKHTDIPELWHRTLQGRASRDGKQHYEAAVALICSMAQCSSRGASDPSHHYLSKLCDRLDSAAELEVGMSRSLRVDCAFLLAERTNDLRDLAFAESFDLRRASRGNPVSSSPFSSSLSVTGFRWDEGISEWVTETPAVRRRSSRQLSREDTRSTSDVETRPRNADGTTDEDPHPTSSSDPENTCSASQGGLRRNEPRQTRATVRAGNNSQQGMNGQQHNMRGRKRGVAAAGLLSLQNDDDDDLEDQVAGRQKGSSQRQEQQQQQQQQRRWRCSSGKENTTKIPGEGAPPLKRRRRVSAMRPRQSALTNITNVGPDEGSSDELGL